MVQSGLPPFKMGNTGQTIKTVLTAQYKFSGRGEPLKVIIFQSNNIRFNQNIVTYS